MTRIHSTSKKKLAGLYFPDHTDFSAAFRRMIHNNATLMNELKSNRYCKCQKILTAQQVELILKHCGEPEVKLNSVLK